MSPAEFDRELLLGLLALRSGLVDRQVLVQALADWRREPARSLEQHLAASGAIAADDLAALVDLRRRSLARHDDQATQTLATLDATEPLLNDLRRAAGDPFPDASHTTPQLYPPQPLPEPVPGSPGDRFHLLKFHARGGLGEVYVAHDQALDRDVAVKQIRPEHADNPSHRADFLREAHLTGLLEHPGVVPVYGLGTHADGRPFYAMRFIEGENLRAAVGRYHRPGQPEDQRRVALRELLRRFIEVCNTLAFAHSRGIIHRDLKPDNVMLGKYGETLVVDWGLARFIHQNEVATAATVLTGVETVAGQVKGTPSYMAPEQAAGRQDLGPACDVYGLGATLFYLLTGQPPVEGSGVELVLFRVQRGEVRRPREVTADVPAGLEAVCLKALALKPEDRYASASDLASDIARWLADEPPLAYREPLGERLGRLARRHRSATVAFGVALVGITLVSLLALYFVNQSRQAESRAYALNTVQRDLRDSLREMVWDGEHLAGLDAKLAELERLAPAEAPRARAEAIEKGLQATQTDELQNWVRSQLQALGPLDPQRATELQQRFAKRLTDWRELFLVEAPFANLAEVFDPARVQVAGATLLPIASEPKPEGPVLVRTRVSTVGPVLLQARFDGTWTRTPILGLALQAGPSGGYQFLLSSFEYSARAAQDLDRRDPLEVALKSGERIYASISRDGVVLAQTQMLLAPGELTLQAQRVGDHLRFQVNKLSLDFEDLFAPVPPADAPFGLIWSGAVRLERLQGFKQSIPLAPSPMEEGDRLFARQQFDEAIRFFLTQAQQTSNPGVAAQARFKAALCLYERGRKDEASTALKELSADKSKESAVARTRTLALARLWFWALREERDREADELYKQLPADFPVEQLVTLIPAEERKPILDAVRLRGPRWRAILEPAGQVDRLNRALALEYRLNESAYERRQTGWKYIDLKRALGDTLLARNLMDLLLQDTTIPADERVTYVRDLIWMLIEPGPLAGTPARLAEAHKVIDRELGGSMASEFFPLYLERARVFAAEQKWDLAEKEVETYLRKMPPGEGHYGDYADACLLKGFLRLQQGDSVGARQAWQRGLLRNWRGSLPLPPSDRLPSGIVEHQIANAGQGHMLLAALTNQWSDKETDPIFLGMLTKFGLRNKTIDVVLKQNFSAEFIKASAKAMCADAVGMEIARKAVFRQVDFVTMYKEPLKQSIVCAFREGSIRGLLLPGQTGPQPLDPGRDERTRAALTRFLDAALAGQLDEDSTANLFRLWQPAPPPAPPPAEVWAALAAALTPELRLSAAYLFAQRLLFLERAADARLLLKELADSTDPHFARERDFAARELRNLRPEMPDAGRAAGLLVADRFQRDVLPGMIGPHPVSFSPSEPPMNARMVLGTSLLTLTLASLATAAPPIEKLLPGTTREFLQIPSVATLEKNWAKTQYGKLTADPAMKDFLDSLGAAGWLPGPVPARLELSPEELGELCGGGAGWAFVYPVAGKGAQVLWIDTTGKVAAREKWIERVAGRIKKAGGKLTEEKIAGQSVAVYEITRGNPVFALTREDLLILTENREVLEGIVGRWASGTGSLGQVAAFQSVMARLGTTPADIHFFIDPIGRLEMLRASNPIPPRGSKTRDLLPILRKQGVDGIKGVGASVRLATGNHDLLYRVVFNAPPPLRGGLDVLRLVPGAQFTPETWVPAELASCATVYIDLGAAFNAIGPVFDQVAPGAKEGTFKELVESLRDDPKGPRVDLRKDFIERLQSRVTIINPAPDPRDARPDRILVVIPVRELDGLQKTLRRMFDGDEGVKRVPVLGQEIWVVESQARKKKPGEPPTPPSRTAFCAANGCFYMSSRPDLVESCLRRGVTGKCLANDTDYKLVAAELERLTLPGAKVALRIFSRPEQDYRDLYESARLKKQPDMESNGWALVSLFVGRVLTGDMGKLPPFAKVAPYLGSAGTLGILHDDGWEVIGFSLPR